MTTLKRPHTCGCIAYSAFAEHSLDGGLQLHYAALYIDALAVSAVAGRADRTTHFPERSLLV